MHFNFSHKSDPFLVFPSSKHNAVGGAMGLKKNKIGTGSQKNKFLMSPST